MTRTVRLGIAAAALAGVALAAAAEVTGKAQAIDGDTLAIGGQRIRLHGIDAPDRHQTCTAEGRQWRCGEEAMFALAHAMLEHWVRCEEKGREADGTLLAVCHIGPYDLNARMVREGWAVADRRQTDAYVGEEAQARAARAGLWQGAFLPPSKRQGN